MPKYKLIRIITHILVWSLITFLLFMYPPLASKGAKLPGNFVIKQIVHISFMWFAYYFNAYVLIPKLLLKNKPLVFAASIFVFVFLSSFTLATVDKWLGIAEQLELILGRKIWSNRFIDFFGLLTTLFVVGISTSIAVVDNWNQDLKARKEYENQKVMLELSFLKAQIHPHFFFNTLHTIYALTYKNVEASRKVLNKLSRMMRYLLYETGHDKTPLAKEVAFIHDYVEIMRLRVKDNTIIQFSSPESSGNFQIAPMLLLPYVENAFKHGIDDIEKTVILIKLELVPHGLALTVHNKIVGKIGGLVESGEASGIGLNNTERRLELLYKDKYNLNNHIDPVRNEYHLYLQLNLT